MSPADQSIGNTTDKPDSIHTVPVQINGAELHLSSTFDVHSPTTNTLIHRAASANVSEALSVVGAAQAAFPAWRDLAPSAKRDIFLKTAEILTSRVEELKKYTVDETGATEGWAAFDISLATEVLLDVAGRISSLKGEVPNLADPGRSAIVYKEPYGVILAIAPWNAPFVLGVRSVAYALAAGNTAVLKANEHSPRCTWAIASCFASAGLPPGVLNTLSHSAAAAPSITSALINDARIRKINFTGSTAVGRIIAEMAGRALKPVLLELGGKAPAIVWEDADLELAATECAKGAFLHCGQVCMSTEAILVHKSVAGAFGERLKAKVGEMFGVGVLVNRAGVEWESVLRTPGGRPAEAKHEAMAQVQRGGAGEDGGCC